MARRVFPSRLELKRRGRIVERGPFREGHLHDAFVRFPGAEDAVVRPHRDAAPLPLLDHLGVRLPDDLANAGKHVAAPVAELPDPSVDEARRRGFVAGCAFAHGAGSVDRFLLRGPVDLARFRHTGGGIELDDACARVMEDYASATGRDTADLAPNDVYRVRALPARVAISSSLANIYGALR
jgi:hypothetical protein